MRLTNAWRTATESGTVGRLSLVTIVALPLGVAGCLASHRPSAGLGAHDAGLDARLDADAMGRDGSTTDAPRRDAPRIDVGSDGGRACVSHCTDDAQCATTCPRNPLGANCCDTLAGVCYASTRPVCPSSEPVDAGPCGPSCETDADCAASCPSHLGMVSNCCDRVTRSCYSVLLAPCPLEDGG